MYSLYSVKAKMVFINIDNGFIHLYNAKTILYIINVI